MEDYSLIINWSNEVYTELYEPNDLVYETSGDVLLIKYCDVESDKKFLIAKFTVFFADCARACREGYEVFDVFDAHSQSMLEYYGALYNISSRMFKTKVKNLFKNQLSGNNLFVIDRLEILPEYRGNGFGIKIINFLISRFSLGASFVAIKPYPLQFESANSCEYGSDWNSKMNLSSFIKNEKESFNKLQSYYARLGFVKLPKTPYMLKQI